MTTAIDVPQPSTRSVNPEPPVRLRIEYWTVTMNGQSSCGSCDETLTGLTQALGTIEPLARRIGIAVEVEPRACTTWAEAIDHAIAASPTIRAAGLELRPSHPDGSEARAWRWHGTTTSTASPQALLDFLLQAVAARSREVADYLDSGGPSPYVRQFLPADRAIDTASEAPSSSDGGCGCGPAAAP